MLADLQLIKTCPICGAEFSKPENYSRPQWAKRVYCGRRCRDTAHSRTQRGAIASQWKGDAVTYRGAHARTVRTRGKASEHPCVECGRPASEWALNRTRAKVLQVSPTGLAYSSDPGDYDPRCYYCHQAHDLSHEIACDECGTRFTAKQATTRFCSKSCGLRSWRRRPKEEKA